MGVQKNDLEVVKEGSWENIDAQQGHVAVLVPFFQELSVNESLICALSLALGKMPAERGPFDNIVVQQLEGKLAKRVSELDEQLVSATTELADKTTGVQEAQEAAKAAKETYRVCTENLGAAKVEREELQIAFDDTQRAVDEHPNMVKQAALHLSTERPKLGHLSEVVRALAFLWTRGAPQGTPQGETGETGESSELLGAGDGHAELSALSELSSENDTKMMVESPPAAVSMLAAGA